MSLNLVPNEIVGYRIRPDWYSYNVVLVKLKGANSKEAGKEYETTLAYCKNLHSAAQWIFSHVVRVQGEMNQKDLEAATGSVADIKGLVDSFEKAQAHVMRAVDELQARITAAGITQKELVKALGSAPAEEEEQTAS